MKILELLIKLPIAIVLFAIGAFIGAWTLIGIAYALSPQHLPGNLSLVDLWGFPLLAGFCFACCFGALMLVVSVALEKRVMTILWQVGLNLYCVLMELFVMAASLNASRMGKLAPGSGPAIVLLCILLLLYPIKTAIKLSVPKIKSS